MRKNISIFSMRSSKRNHEQLVAYWHRIKGLSQYPTESQVDPDDLKEQWDNMFLLEVDQEQRGIFRYQYVGSSLVEAYGTDPTGKAHNSQEIPNVRSMFELGAKVATTGEVCTDESWFLNSKLQKIVYRCSLVPLCSPTDRVNVHFILGLMSWRREGRAQASI